MPIYTIDLYALYMSLIPQPLEISMPEHIQIHTTTETKEDAERVGRALLDRGLAACVQILGPMKSIYRWKGEVTEGEEWLCLIKTREDRYEEVERAILEMHPYEVPEIIAVPISRGYEEYLRWIDGNVR